MAAVRQSMRAIDKLPPLTLRGFKKYRSRAEGRRNNGIETALIPAFSPKEKVKRSQRFGIHPRLDWWMRIKQPDDFKGKNPRLGERVGQSGLFFFPPDWLRY